MEFFISRLVEAGVALFRSGASAVNLMFLRFCGLEAFQRAELIYSKAFGGRGMCVECIVVISLGINSTLAEWSIACLLRYAGVIRLLFLIGNLCLNGAWLGVDLRKDNIKTHD